MCLGKISYSKLAQEPEKGKQNVRQLVWVGEVKLHISIYQIAHYSNILGHTALSTSCHFTKVIKKVLMLVKLSVGESQQSHADEIFHY